MGVNRAFFAALPASIRRVSEPENEKLSEKPAANDESAKPEPPATDTAAKVPEGDDAQNGDDIELSQDAAGEKTRDWGLLLWVAGILVVLGVELFIYGHNGRIEVCVGLEGATDFSLIGKPRSPENFRSYPLCVERMNLGMWSSSEEQAQSALEAACSRATARGNPEAKQQCLRKENKWQRQVIKESIPPWDPRLYRRLLFLD